MPTPTSPVLGAAELALSQAVPETTVNEIVRLLEQGALAFAVADKDLTAPPGSPADGDAYIVAASPTGAWSGKAKDIAFYQTGTGWRFITPREGFRADVADEDVAYRYDGTAWVSTAVTSYTDEQARDAIGTALVAGTGVSISVNDGADTITISGDPEFIRDTIGTALTAGTGISLTVNDAGDTITITNTAPAAGTYTDENARDAIGTALVAGSGITIAVDDGGDTITIKETSYTCGFFFTTVPTASEVLALHVAGASFTIPANFSGGLQSSVGTNPTATFALDVQKNGSSIGTLSVSTGGVVTATTVGGTSKSIAAGDVIKIVAPGSADATAANMAFTLIGAR